MFFSITYFVTALYTNTVRMALCPVSDSGSLNSLEFVESFRNLPSSVQSFEVSSRIIKVMKFTKMSCSNLANFFPFWQQTSIQPRNTHLSKKNIHTIDSDNFSLQCCTSIVQLNFAVITNISAANHSDDFVQWNNTGSAIGLEIEQPILGNFKGSM